MSIEVVKQAERMEVLKLSDIRTNDEALRGVNKDDVDYLELAASVATDGVLQPISVREMIDTDTNQRYFQLIDGLQRFTAAGDAGLETIKAVIRTASDEEVFKQQIKLNIFRVDTKPVEYTHQLRRILRMDPSMTMAQLAREIGKTDSWLKQRLELMKLCTEIAQLVDGGQINLNNAYALSKLPPENQMELAEAAMSKTYQEFAPLAEQRRKELNKARREGKSEEPVVFEPRQALRKAGDIKEEMNASKAASAVLAESGATTAADGWTAALKWVLSLDPITVAEQKAKWETDQAAAQKKREDAKKEREARSEKAGEIKAARMKLQLEMSEAGKSNAEIIAALAEFDIANNVPVPAVRKPKDEKPAADGSADAPADSSAANA